MWQKNGKGPLYRSIRVKSESKFGGEKMILIAVKKNKKGGEYRNVEAKSWQVLKACGWKKVS